MFTGHQILKCRTLFLPHKVFLAVFSFPVDISFFLETCLLIMDILSLLLFLDVYLFHSIFQLTAFPPKMITMKSLLLNLSLNPS